MIDALYIHLPFCSRICSYCDFPKLVGDSILMDRYLSGLSREIEHYRSQFDHLSSLYLGGGTPTALGNERLRRLFRLLRESIDLTTLREFSIEANPSDITLELAHALVQGGVSRVSLGAQSSHKRLLEFLGRDHQKADIEHAVKTLREAGIREINLDFIYGIPSETMVELQEDIAFATSLRVDHLSFYSLILEEKTLLFHRYQKKQFDWLDDDTIAEMTETVMHSLPQAGYLHYEISNYALLGKESWHNLAYWEIRPYLGLGMGAHSQVDQRRFHNAPTIQQYLKQVDQSGFGKTDEDPCDLAYETVLMGLRLRKGISLSAFKNRFGVSLLESYPGLKNSITNGLLELTEDVLRPTERGCLLLDYVLRHLEAEGTS